MLIPKDFLFVIVDDTFGDEPSSQVCFWTSLHKRSTHRVCDVMCRLRIFSWECRHRHPVGNIHNTANALWEDFHQWVLSDTTIVSPRSVIDNDLPDINLHPHLGRLFI